MQKYFQKIKTAYMVISAVYVVFGFFLLIWPELSIKTVCYAIGAILLVYGIVSFTKYFSSKEEKSFYELNFILAVITTVMGIIVVIKPSIIVSIFSTILGIILLLSGIVKLQDALELKKNSYKNWKVIFIFSMVSIALGIIMIVSPFTIRIFIRFIGASFIVDGVLSIISGALVKIKV